MRMFQIMVGDGIFVGYTEAESIDGAAKQLGCKLLPHDFLSNGFRALTFLRSWSTMSGNLMIREVHPYLSGMHDLCNVLSSLDELVEVK